MTDADRFKFLEVHKLSVTWSDDGASIFWRGKAKPGQPGGYYPISQAPTLEASVDLAIAKWERKHKKPFVA